MLNEIRDLFDYTDWANRRAFDAASRLTDEQLHREVGGSFPSVYRTLHHIASAEWIWLMRWLGTSYGAPPASWQVSTLPELRELWEGVARDRAAFLRDLDEAGLAGEFEYRNLKGDRFRGRLVETLRHVVNHSSYHRGQVTTMIRQVGGEPVNTDLILFYRERGSQTAG